MAWVLAGKASKAAAPRASVSLVMAFMADSLSWFASVCFRMHSGDEGGCWVLRGFHGVVMNGVRRANYGVILSACDLFKECNNINDLEVWELLTECHAEVVVGTHQVQ